MTLLQRVSMLVTVLVLGACASAPETKYLEPLHQAKLQSILVVPVNNNTIDVQAPTSVLATLPFMLAEKGYYTYPVNTVKMLLEAEGYYEAAEVHAAPADNLAALFGADAILYVTIHEWTAQYMVLATHTKIDFEYRLVNAQGQLLWQARKELVYAPQQQNSSGNPLADLVAMAITAAIERAAPNYLPLTRTANGQVFYGAETGLPPGPYHPKYAEYYQKLEQPKATQ
ncbi:MULTISPECIES: GNA1162 family protein [Pseudidiomarina]|uniref:Lipoprotein n=2 Tax=Pseudidiomarina TaxID=2800384 RepID=A0A368UYD1_9GAMM|nr:MULTISPECIES: GNA1162 family protein [Pseudidiomarina]PWW13677.1 hypothetical protein DET45_10522 [Pseudidiomarina maritima]RBP91071.1 hypothetical protein DFO81_10522 [Pseudidiomarina tainanensis]RCW33085.1 hypothetical protein DFO79_10522 [Pseudidiomarina tainanensis]